MGRKKPYLSELGAAASEDRQVKKPNLSELGDFVGDENVEQVLHIVDSESVSAAAAEDRQKLKREVRGDDGDARFLGEPVPEEEAKERWPQRYRKNEPVYNGPCKCTEPKIPSCYVEFAPVPCSWSSRKRSHDSISANSFSIAVRVGRALQKLKELGHLSIVKGKTASMLYSNLISKGQIVTVEMFLDEEDIEKQVSLVEEDLKFFEDYARILH